jgi:hypothetical protein
MNTISDIFDVFGGNAAVARILGVGASTASEMKRRESIPVEYWPALVDEAKKAGRDDVTLESIAIVMAEAGARRRTAKVPAGAAA